MSFALRRPSNLTRMAVNATSALQEQDLLAAARGGDEDAFRRIVEEHRLPLQAHCYRMLGSLQDAEDALQETFLRAWRGLSEFGGRSSLRTWLYRIATNVCIDASSRRSKRMLPTDVGPSRSQRRRSSARRVDLGRALSGRDARHPRWVRGARSSLRAAGSRRARLRRLAPASAGEPARGPDPARRARLLGQGGRGAARHVRRLGEQRPAAGPQSRRRATTRAEPASDAAVAR